MAAKLSGESNFAADLTPKAADLPSAMAASPALEMGMQPGLTEDALEAAMRLSNASEATVLRDRPGRGADGQPLDFVNLGTLMAAGMVVSGTNRTRISEEYRIAVSRILKSSLKRRPTDGRPKAGELLMVTSARPGEGKTFTSLNLAGAIAHNLMRPTVLVDVDFKKRSVTDLLRLGDRKGLLDVASTGRVQIESLIIPTAIEHLSVLPVGRDAGDLEGGMDRRPVAEVIEYLASRFPDYIFVLDLPPCLSTSDPSTLAPVVNEVIMVIEAQRTQRSEVESALDLIKLAPKISVMLNKIRTTRRHTFGAYDYYGSYS
jgi:receptor protein-tyrosine kinase